MNPNDDRVMKLWNGFEEKVCPGTGRKAVQLTKGDANCYPLYYYIPTFSGDGKRLIYHRAGGGELQMHCLTIETGESVQLTHGTTPETRWIPWCMKPGPGVLDHRSVLDVARDRLIYVDNNEFRWVRLDGKDDLLLFSLPEDRTAIGQNCISPDGDWLVYIHHDRANFAEVYPDGQWGDRGLSKGTVLAAFNLVSGEHRTLITINSAIHHVLPFGKDKLVFCHPAKEMGMLMTDLNGGWYTHLRTMDDNGGQVCHYVPTERGIAYEILGRRDGQVLSGLYNPDSHNRFEFAMPESFGYTHTGKDPEGRLWFYENSSEGVHDLHFLAKHTPDGQDEWVPLTGNWPTYSSGQKSHFHPQLTPDRKWILMTGGDPDSETNHIFLIDLSDLNDTEGIPDV